MKVLDAEKNIGIETFFTPFKGIGGKLRTVSEDFAVTEVSKYPPAKEGIGKFSIADVSALNWETNLLVRELSDRLHISRQRINFAGTKDKRSMSKRLMSFFNVSKEKLSEIQIKNVAIENVYYSDFPVKIGDHYGNKFEIKIRNLDSIVKKDSISEIKSFIEKNGGFPNFYGVQRFGVARPITHVVGRFIVKNDFENAVWSYVANPMKSEKEETRLLRENLQKTRDIPTALKSYTNDLGFEKAILNKLVNEPENYVDALKELPKNLLTMFIYAYQSNLFNRIISERIRRKIPLNKAIVGDLVLPIRKDLVEEKGILVKETNIEKVNKQISKNKAAVSGILFGFDTVFSEGEMGEIEHKIIDGEKIDPRDFIIPEMPFMSSSGSRRALLAYIKDLDFELIDDKLNKGKKSLNIEFELQKGCYATSLLREFMKADDIKNY